MENEIRIRDLIIDIPTETLSEPEKKSNSSRTAPLYEIVLENDSDFAIRRTTTTTQKLLVCILSQGLVYFKDERTNEVDSKISANRISAFMKDCSLSLTFEKLQYQPFNFRFSDKRPNEFFSHAIKSPALIKELVNNKIFSISNEILEALKNDKDSFLFCYFFAKEAATEWKSLYKNLNRLKQLGINEDKLKFNLQKIKDMKKDASFFDEKFYEALETSNCDFNTFIDYLLFDINNENLLRISNRGSYGGSSFTFSEYVDHIRMQKEMFGNIKEKYPKNFLSDKARLTARYSIWKEAHKEDVFLANSQELAKLSYTGKKYSIVVPQNSNEIIEEGYQLKHCVGSYVDKIINHQTNILFMRLSDDLETSLVTVEVVNNAVVQFQGLCRRPLYDEERTFLIEWAKTKNLDFSKLKQIA